MRIATITLCALVLTAVEGAQVEGYRGAPTPGSATAGAQDAVYLDRRISLLETRLSSIESSLRTLEQQSMMLQRSATSQPARDPETQLLRSELEILKVRVTELECGLAHVDERTLAARAKETGKQTSAQPKDPCRLNPDAPVKLSTHQ